jgi:hypothetical protein
MTALRSLAAIVFFLLMFPHDLTRPVVVGALATTLCLLAVVELSIRDISPNGLLITVAGILALSAMTWIGWRLLFPPPPEPTGPLIPAGEAMPVNNCPAGPDDLVIAVGTDRVMAEGAGPHRPFMAHFCPGPVLTRTPKGLMVDAFGYDWANDLVYMIRDNRLDYLMVAGLTLRRPDRSTLELLDRYGDPVVYVRYLNRDAVRIRGRWLCNEEEQLLVHDATVRMGGVRIAGAMFGTHPVAGHRCARLKSVGNGGIQYGKLPPPF